MGADLSNCQFTKLGDACYSPVSMINTTLSQAAESNFVLSLEKSKFKKENNDYWFTCQENSVPYNGTLSCNIAELATITCGSKNITFSHREYCLFGFQFRKNETVIFDSRDLQKPLLAFPLPAKELIVTTQLYTENFQEKWVLRTGNSGYVPNAGIRSIKTIENPKSQKTPFDTFSSNNTSIETDSKAEEEKEDNRFIIPVDQKKIESGGTLSFTLPFKKAKESGIKVIISNTDEKNIIGLEFSKCCAKLIDYNNEKYDKFSYPEELTRNSNVDLNLEWQPSIYTLKIKASNTKLASIPTENKNIPYRALLIESSTREELNANWSYSTGVKDSGHSSCTINELDGKCKSTSVTISKMINPNIEFLRFGFPFSKAVSTPFQMVISQDSNNLATLEISSKMIKVHFNSTEEIINLNKEISTAEWVSGDIFLVSDDIHNVIEEDETIRCKSYSDSCLNSQSSMHWMSLINEKYLLRYAYLKKQALENKAKMEANEEDDSSSSNSKTEHYLYISFRNCIIAKIKVKANSFNKVSVSNKQATSDLTYWRLKRGVSTSINIQENDLSNLKTNIPKEIKESENKSENENEGESKSESSNIQNKN